MEKPPKKQILTFKWHALLSRVMTAVTSCSTWPGSLCPVYSHWIFYLFVPHVAISLLLDHYHSTVCYTVSLMISWIIELIPEAGESLSSRPAWWSTEWVPAAKVTWKKPCGDREATRTTTRKPNTYLFQTSAMFKNCFKHLQCIIHTPATEQIPPKSAGQSEGSHRGNVVLKSGSHYVTQTEC